MEQPFPLYPLERHYLEMRTTVFYRRLFAMTGFIGGISLTCQAHGAVVFRICL